MTGAPAFKENQLAFGVVYGLCLQMLGQGPISTNLVPREIVVERIIRAKKPWAVLALAPSSVGLSSIISSSTKRKFLSRTSMEFGSGRCQKGKDGIRQRESRRHQTQEPSRFAQDDRQRSEQ